MSIRIKEIPESARAAFWEQQDDGVDEWDAGFEEAFAAVFASMSPEQLREFASGLLTEANEREGYKEKKSSGIGTNTGHGHVWERPDGMKARCGGPGICSQCSSDKFDVEAGL